MTWLNIYNPSAYSLWLLYREQLLELWQLSLLIKFTLLQSYKYICSLHIRRGMWEEMLSCGALLEQKPLPGTCTYITILIPPSPPPPPLPHHPLFPTNQRLISRAFLKGIYCKQLWREYQKLTSLTLAFFPGVPNGFIAISFPFSRAEPVA